MTCISFFRLLETNRSCEKHRKETDQLVLVSGDGGELGLGEDEGLVLLELEVLEIDQILVLAYHVDPRLVLVHRVQDHLRRRNKEERSS